MNKKIFGAIFVLLLVVCIGLYTYGYNKGESMGITESSSVTAGLFALSLDPISREGFAYGYQEGLKRAKELKEWRLERYGPWTDWSSRDQITDFENQFLSTSGDIGPYSDKASLILRCMNNKSEAYVKWGGYLIEKNGEFKVTYRIDDEAPVTQNWNLSTDKEAFFFSGSNIAFMKSLLDKKKLVVQFQDRNIRTVTFQLDKLSEKIVSLRSSCGWSA